MEVHYGKLEVDPRVLSEIYQDTIDLIDKMIESEKLSEAQNTRDRKYYKKTFESLIERLGNFFKPPILSEEEADKDVDCLALVSKYIPQLSIENVRKLGEILKLEGGCSQEDVHFNAIMRRFHRIRYLK